MKTPYHKVWRMVASPVTMPPDCAQFVNPPIGPLRNGGLPPCSLERPSLSSVRLANTHGAAIGARRDRASMRALLQNNMSTPPIA